MPEKTNNYRVVRRCVVNLVTDIITCSSPITAIVATDNLSDYPTMLRQLTRDGIVISVEFEELDGAMVEEMGNESQFFEFEEDDIKEIKDSFGIR